RPTVAPSGSTRKRSCKTPSTFITTVVFSWPNRSVPVVPSTTWVGSLSTVIVIFLGSATCQFPPRLRLLYSVAYWTTDKPPAIVSLGRWFADSRPLFIVELDIINDTNWILQNGHCIGALLIDTNVVVAGAFVSGVDDVPWRMALRLTVTHRGCDLLWW